VGDWGLFSESNGVEVSFDAGISYSTINVSSLTADSRYGAFPDDKTWFIAAGDWPGEGADDDPTDNPPSASRAARFARAGDAVHPEHYVNAVEAGSTLVKMQSARVHLVKSPSGAVHWAWVKKEAFAAAVTGTPGLSNSSTSWDAQVARTTDGGKTWSVVYSKLNGQFYFNGIECTSTQQCCVVGETGDSSTASGGTYIWCTADGGDTWTESLLDNDPDSSLTDIAALGPQEYWAVGGEFAWYGIANPHFYHTLDGGASWTLTNGTNMSTQYAIAVDCVPGAACWANLLDVLTQESSIAATYV
jgi:hypothetical protein